MSVEHRAAGPGRPALEIHRSQRRRRTAHAHAREGAVVVRLPAGMPADEEERVIDRLVRRVTGAAAAAAFGGDAALTARAAQLADRYLDGVRPVDVRWSGRMTRQHGSCSPGDGTIRISRDVAGYPGYVRDYVLVHELVHLTVPGHGAPFQALVRRYPHVDRARGWLDGFSAGKLAAATPPDPAQAEGSPSLPSPSPPSPSPSSPPLWSDGSAGG